MPQGSVQPILAPDIPGFGDQGLPGIDIQTPLVSFQDKGLLDTESSPDEALQSSPSPSSTKGKRGEGSWGQVGGGLRGVVSNYNRFSSPSLQWPHSSSNFLVISPRHHRVEESCSFLLFYEAENPVTDHLAAEGPDSGLGGWETGKNNFSFICTD